MATRIYTGGGIAGDWADPANWKGGIAPGIKDLAQILGGAGSSVESDVSVNAIMIIDGGTVTFAAAVATAGVGNCQGLMVCIGATAVFGPGSSLSDGGVLQVGVGGVGSFVADGSGTLATTISSKTGTIGKLAGSVGTVTINDASWTADKSLVVGAKGSGTLLVQDGGQVVVGGNFAMGQSANATGTATLSGDGMVTVDGWAAIGGGDATEALGTATLTIDAGSTFDVQHGLSVAFGSAVTLAGGTLSVGDKTGGLDIMAGGEVSGDGTLRGRIGEWTRDDGLIDARGGTLQISGSVTGQGGIQIEANSTAAITGQSLMMPSISFAGPDATLSLAHAASVNSDVTGFSLGDQIDMAGIDAVAWSAMAQTLKLGDAGKTVDMLHLGGSYAGEMFMLTQAHGLGVITLQPTAP